MRWMTLRWRLGFGELRRLRLAVMVVGAALAGLPAVVAQDAGSTASRADAFGTAEVAGQNASPDGPLTYVPVDDEAEFVEDRGPAPVPDASGSAYETGMLGVTRGYYSAAQTNRRGTRPRLILVRPIDPQQQKQLVEDLMVMDVLLTRAIGGDTLQSNPFTRVLGVMVNQRDSQEPRIQFIQDHSIVFQYDVVVPVTPPPDSETREPAGGQQVSEWDAVRRNLFAPAKPSPFAGDSAYRNQKQPPYSAEIVKTLQSRVTQALANIERIRVPPRQEAITDTFPQPNPEEPTVIVVLRGRSDGSVMTLSTTRSRMQQGPDNADSVTIHQYHDRSAEPLRGLAYPNDPFGSGGGYGVRYNEGSGSVGGFGESGGGKSGNDWVPGDSR